MKWCKNVLYSVNVASEEKYVQSCIMSGLAMYLAEDEDEGVGTVGVVVEACGCFRKNADIS